MIVFININTLKNYCKWERLPFESLSCGEYGIRTHGTRESSTGYKSAALDRSANSEKIIIILFGNVEGKSPHNFFKSRIYCSSSNSSFTKPPYFSSLPSNHLQLTSLPI